VLAAGAPAQIVEGSIVNAATNAGIAQVSVHLEPSSEIDSADEPYDTVTDTLGHFTFAKVKPGAYRFTYYSPSYLRTAATPFPHIKVSAGADPLKLEGRMAELPSISGRVVDINGNGIANALVAMNGPAIRMTATTDAAGNFERHLAQPGRYSIFVTPPAGLAPPAPEPGSDQARVWTRVYYPGVASPDAASKIAIYPGDRIPGIQLKLLPVPAHSVRGALLNPDSTPAASVTVALYIDESPADRDQPELPKYQAKTDSEGVFEFPPVADGDWRITAELERGGVKLQALQWIEMAGRDIGNVSLRFDAPFVLQGRVVMEARDGTAAPKPPAVFLVAHAGRIRREFGAASWMLQPETMAATGFQRVLFSQGGAISADPDSAGNFSFKDVYADGYRIAPLAASDGYYLDSVRVGDTDVAASEVQLAAGALPVTIVYKTGGGTVHGTVEKCASGAVLLIPAEADMRWFGFLHSVRCDAKDHYEIGAVRPGEYYAVAFAGSDSDPLLDERILRQAHHITVKPGETVTADIAAIFE